MTARHSVRAGVRNGREPHHAIARLFRSDADRLEQPREMRVHSALIPMLLMTPPHFFASARMNAPNCSGVLASISAPSAREALLHVGRPERLHRLGVQPRDNGFGRTSGRNEAPPRHGFKVRHTGFGERRRVREHGTALCVREREYPHFTGLCMRQRFERVDEHERDTATDDVDECRRATLVRHVQNIDVTDRLEKLAGEVL